MGGSTSNLPRFGSASAYRAGDKSGFTEKQKSGSSMGNEGNGEREIAARAALDAADADERRESR